MIMSIKDQNHSHFRSQVFEKNDHQTFGNIMTEGISRLLREFPDAVIFHFIYDSYVECSLKGPERESRSGKAKGVIHLASIDYNMPVPQQMEKFWNSERNKRMLQEFSKTVMLDRAKKDHLTVVFSGVIDENDELLGLQVQHYTTVKYSS